MTRFWIAFAILLPFLHTGFCKENYEEQLYVNILPNRDLFTFFNFTITADYDNGIFFYFKDNFIEKNSLHYIPWVLEKLLEDQNIEHFQLSLTQGFWRTNLWGYQPYGAEVPTGTLLLVKYEKHNQSVDTRYAELIHQLNGIFCTSFLSINPTLTGSPKLAFPISGNSEWKLGVLSSESVCSENLKPWKKFLPCKQVNCINFLIEYLEWAYFVIGAKKLVSLKLSFNFYTSQKATILKIKYAFFCKYSAFNKGRFE